METLVKPSIITSMTKSSESFPFWGRVLLYAAAAAVHIILLVTLTFNTAQKEGPIDHTIFKVVDITEFVPEEPKEEEKQDTPPPPPDETIEVDPQEGLVEDVEVTEKFVVEAAKPIEYLPQHKISEMPRIPYDEFRSRVVYPTLANKQRIEAVVYLELYIDAAGNLRNIEILKDPGYGLAEAAIKALEGLRWAPARANGEPVAVHIRYPVPFKLK